MTRIGFILKPDKTEAGEVLADLATWLSGEGHRTVVTTEDNIDLDNVTAVPENAFGAETDIAVVLGGDGTMLRASSLVADHEVPVLGINFGRLGFLTQFHLDEARDAIADAVAGRLRVGLRSRLKATYTPANGESIVRSALNDAVIHQGAMARLIELHANLDDELVASYRADGLIVATPTGSTAYNLAAGGPILIPGQAAMTLTPICAHALTNRPLVVPKDATISVTLGGESTGVILTVDGQWARTFLPGDRVDITTAERPLLLFNSSRGYFDIMREKLHWGVRADRRS